MAESSKQSEQRREKREPRWDEIEQHIRENGFLDVLESYPASHIMETLSCFASFQTRNDTLGLLRKAVLARKEVHEIERKMDKSFFKDMVTDSSFAISGINASTGAPILWMDCGVINHNCWKLLPGTGKYYAFVRAVLWMMDLGTFAASSYKKVGMACIMSHVNSSPLDFNVAAFRLILRLYRSQFPLMGVYKHATNLRHVGIGKVVPLPIKLLKEHANLKLRGDFSFIDFEDLWEIVCDPADIPEFILEDDAEPHPMADWNARLRYSRCMSDDNKVSLRELLSYETAAATLTIVGMEEAPKALSKVTTTGLEVLDEDDEEEE